MPKVVHYKKGTVIFFEDTINIHVYILKSGVVVLKQKDENGRDTYSHVSVGEIFGAKSSLAKLPTINSAVALVDSTVVEMSVYEFKTTFGKRLDVTLPMLRAFCDELISAYKKTMKLLGGDTSYIEPDEGMLEVAKAFYNVEHYKSCESVLNRILARYPDTKYRDEIARLMSKADSSQNVWIDTSHFHYSDTEEDVELPPEFDKNIIHFKRGDVLACEHESADKYYLIKSGGMLAVKHIADHVKLLDVLGPGHFIGQTAVIDTLPRIMSYVARSDGECYEFTKDDNKALLGANGTLMCGLLGAVSRRIYNQERQYEALCIKDVTARICDIIVMYDEIYGDAAENDRNRNSISCEIYVTVKELASLAGMSANRVKAELKTLEDHKKLYVYDDRIEVINIFELKRRVDAYYASLSRQHGVG